MKAKQDFQEVVDGKVVHFKKGEAVDVPQGDLDRFVSAGLVEDSANPSDDGDGDGTEHA